MVSEPAQPAPVTVLRAPPSRLHNLPVPPDALIGREGELAAARSLIEPPDIRLVTFTGTGGTGKTRLALALAAEFGVSAYDARFLGAAQRLGARLVTEDARLRAAAPALTCSLAEALAR